MRNFGTLKIFSNPVIAVVVVTVVGSEIRGRKKNEINVVYMCTNFSTYKCLNLMEQTIYKNFYFFSLFFISCLCRLTCWVFFAYVYGSGGLSACT